MTKIEIRKSKNETWEQKCELLDRWNKSLRGLKNDKGFQKRW